MRVHGGMHSIRNCALMHQSEACAGPVHLTGQAQPLNLPPRLQQPNVDLVSPTSDVRLCDLRVLPAETMKHDRRFLCARAAGGLIEWLSIMTHGGLMPVSCMGCAQHTSQRQSTCSARERDTATAHSERNDSLSIQHSFWVLRAAHA